MDALELRVEAAPAGDAVDVGRHLGRRQRLQLVEAERERLLDLAGHLERPGGEVDVRHLARVEHRPLLREVLAGRQAGRVEARLARPCPLLSIGRGASIPTLVGVDIAARERAFVRVAGPDACDYLQRMVSNDVEALQVGDACPALLLTAKARLIAPLVVWRRGDDDFLAADRAGARRAGARAPDADAPARAVRDRAGGAHARCSSSAARGSRPTSRARVEVLDSGLEPTLDADELERRRVEAGVPRWGRELDDRILPAEAGLDATHINFGKGCYPGQEPIARLHYRGKANRALRVLELADVPPVRRGARARRQGRRAGDERGAPARRLRRRARLRASRGAGRRAARARPCRGLRRPTGGRSGVRRTSKPATYRCPLCGYRLHAMSAARADRAGRRHVAPPARACRVRRRREPDDVRRLAPRAATPAGLLDRLLRR